MDRKSQTLEDKGDEDDALTSGGLGTLRKSDMSGLGDLGQRDVRASQHATMSSLVTMEGAMAPGTHGLLAFCGRLLAPPRWPFGCPLRASSPCGNPPWPSLKGEGQEMKIFSRRWSSRMTKARAGIGR